MATFKNVSDSRVDIPLYDLHLAPGDTFEVPDEVAASFDSQPTFARSKTQNPTTVVDPAIVESSIPAGDAIPPLSPAIAPDAPATATAPTAPTS